MFSYDLTATFPHGAGEHLRHQQVGQQTFLWLARNMGNTLVMNGLETSENRGFTQPGLVAATLCCDIDGSFCSIIDLLKIVIHSKLMQSVKSPENPESKMVLTIIGMS